MFRGDVRLTVNADKHAAQFPQFKESLAAATPGDCKKTCTEDDDSMAADVRRMRQGRRQRPVGVAVLTDNEIIGNFIPVIPSQTRYIGQHSQILSRFLFHFIFVY